MGVIRDGDYSQSKTDKGIIDQVSILLICSLYFVVPTNNFMS